MSSIGILVFEKKLSFAGYLNQPHTEIHTHGATGKLKMKI